jgi:hypothetical protein
MKMTGLSHLFQWSTAALPIPHLSDCYRLQLVGWSNREIVSTSILTNVPGIFLISIFGVQVRGVATPNVLVGVLIFFGGICQFISGIMEFVSGNTVRPTSFNTMVKQPRLLTGAQYSSGRLSFPLTAPSTSLTH